MATTKTVLPGDDILARPYHATDLKAVYNTGDVAASGLDPALTKSAVTEAVDIALEAFKSQWPFESEAAFDTAVDDLKTTIQTATDTAIDEEESSDVTFHTILDTVRTDYEELAQSDVVTNPPTGLIYTCPQCLGNGKNVGYNPDGSPDGVYRQSEVCDGYGFTSVQKIKDPNAGFINQP